MTPSELIMQILVKSNVVPEGYTGQVILHVGNGELCNIEPRERPKGTDFIQRLGGMNERIFVQCLNSTANKG